MVQYGTENRSLSLIALALGVVAVAMLLPMAYAALEADWRPARGFLFGAVATGFAAGILGVSLSGRSRLRQGQGELLSLFAIWLLVPPFAALPLNLITPSIGYHGAWFEMAAAFTTTGGTIYLTPEDVPSAIHLWRGMVGWLGGLTTLVAAYAILAPRRLGGFEVLTQTAGDLDPETVGKRLEIGAAIAPVEARAGRALRKIVPVYFGLTLVLGLGFGVLGKDALGGAVHAMSILSTSGISPYSNGFAVRPDFSIELLAAVFLVLASTRLIYARASQIGQRTPVMRDPELGLLATLVALATLALFARHWFGALTVEGEGEGIWEAVSALWGSFFTVLSFATTTGFESGYWERARDWSGLSNPGLVLLGLCAIGGGAATTAGGIKLIRAFALLRHGKREIERLSQPNAVLGIGTGIRGLLRQGAFIAWAFIMLYIFAVFMLTLGLSLAGLRFQTALIGALTAITNTGPAFELVLGEAFGGLPLLDQTQRSIMVAGMILGRIETLVVIALFSPDVWRRLSSRKKSTGKARMQAPKSGW